MKLKLLLLALLAAGFAASMALASDGRKNDHGNSCSEAHIQGTIAPQALTLTVAKASENTGLAAGSTVALALGAAGQVVRVNVEACSTGTGSSLQLTVRSLELKVKRTPDTSTGTTGSTKHKDDDGKGHHKGTTTTTTVQTTTTTP